MPAGGRQSGKIVLKAVMPTAAWHITWHQRGAGHNLLHRQADRSGLVLDLLMPG